MLMRRILNDGRNLSVSKCENHSPNEPCPCGSAKKYKKCCVRGDGELIPPFSQNHQPERLGFTDSSCSHMPAASRSGNFRFPTFVRDNAVR